MSLLSSIFGGADNSGGGGSAASDLFTNSVSSAPKEQSTTTTSNSSKNESADKNKKKKQDDDQSSSSSNSVDAVSTAKEQPTIEESEAPPIIKKSREQLQEVEARTLFVGNLPTSISRKALASIFKSCGTVVSARLRSVAVTGVKLPPEQAGNQNMMRKVCANTGKVLADTPKKSAQGYVVFESLESIPAALQLNNTIYESHSIRVDHADPTIEPTRTVFVGNLPYGADEETLRSHFIDHLNNAEDLNESEGSAVQGVRIIREKETQKCKGFGYVMLRDATLVPLALDANETKYMKRELRVMVCGKRFKSSSGGSNSGKGRRSFEGQRATGSGGTSSNKKRNSQDGAPNSGKAKKRRARSDKKSNTGSSKTGDSKRVTTERKVNKRVKKLQKRVVKGMGKKQH